MNAAEFAAKWEQSKLGERQAAQSHYLDLCKLFQFPTPTDEDLTGETYCFEKGTKKSGGAHGWADVWRLNHFAWEYKKKHKDLEAAFDQLKKYQGNLGNPPLLITCDMERIVVETHWTGVVSKRHEIPLRKFAEPKSQDLLRRVFHDPRSLKPDETPEKVTKEVMKRFRKIADSVRANQKPDSTRFAHYLTRLVFCLFAEDAGILPDRVFSQIVENPSRNLTSLNKDIRELFEAMATGGSFWGKEIPHVNGSLFDDTPALDFEASHFSTFKELCSFDWSQMDVSIFGTLFEQVMDESHRSELGAHYTSYDDIATLVEPVVMTPLRRAWDETKSAVAAVLPDVLPASPGGATVDSPGRQPLDRRPTKESLIQPRRGDRRTRITPIAAEEEVSMNAEIHAVDRSRLDSEGQRLSVVGARMDVRVEKKTDVLFTDPKDTHSLIVTGSRIEGKKESTLRLELFPEEVEQMLRVMIKARLIDSPASNPHAVALASELLQELQRDE